MGTPTGVPPTPPPGSRLKIDQSLTLYYFPPLITGQADTGSAGSGPAHYDADVQVVRGSEKASSHRTGADQQSACFVSRRTHHVRVTIYL